MKTTSSDFLQSTTGIGNQWQQGYWFSVPYSYSFNPALVGIQKAEVGDGDK